MARIHVCDLPEKFDQLKADYSREYALVLITAI